MRYMEVIMIHNIKSVLKSVRKNRFFYFINLVGFITGFLVLTIIFNFVFQELSFDRFHTNSDRIYRINCNGYGVTPPCFAEKLAGKIPEIEGVVRFRSENITVVQKSAVVQIGRAYYTDSDIFDQFSFKIISGDMEKALDAPYSMVINQSTADKLFRNESPIGQSIRDKRGTIYTISAVMEDLPFNSHLQANAFVSIETLREKDEDRYFSCGAWSILTYVCLSENADYTVAEQKMNELLYDFRMGNDDGKFHLNLQPLEEVYFGADANKFDGCKHGNRQTVLLYFAISLLILLIVIINYVNLATLISGGRIKEIAIRKINGAGRFQIISQVVFEALVTVLVSFGIALLVIDVLLPQISKLLNISVSDSQNRSVIYLCYFVGILLVGFICGLIPGFVLSKIPEMKALKNELFLSSRGYQRKALLVVQLLIVAVFLNATFIINNQINFVLDKDIGFNYDQVVYFEADRTLAEKGEVLKNKLMQNPEVESVSFSYGVIGRDPGGAVMACNEKRKLCKFLTVDPDYLDLYQMTLRDGRNFSWDLQTDIENNCIINEAACKAFELTDPIGKKVNTRTVIGVVHDFNYTSLHNQVDPLVMFCDKGETTVQVKIASIKKPETIHFIKSVCKDISPDFKSEIGLMDTRIRELYQSEQDLKSSFMMYSVVTFIIALLGLFGLFLFTIRKRAKEICIRKVFGASLNDTFKLLTKEQILIVSVSNILAIPITCLVMNNWLSNFQYRVGPGVLVFFETYVITTVFTLLTIVILIFKTHRTNVVETLKYE